jgi:hypothetical protein
MNETLRMSLTKLGEPPPPPPGTRGGDSAGGGGPIWPLVIVGGVVGVGALAAGGGLFAVAGSKKSEREDLSASLPDTACAPGNTNEICAKIVDLTDQESTFSSAGIGLMVVGGVVLVATGVYLGVALASDDGDASAGALQVTPLVGSESGGLLVSGSF